MTTTAHENATRELTVDEIDAVSGGDGLSKAATQNALDNQQQALEAQRAAAFLKMTQEALQE
jgi:hypothetical protein